MTVQPPPNSGKPHRDDAPIAPLVSMSVLSGADRRDAVLDHLAPIDIVVLSNGPGEVTTWVKPVVRSLRQRLGNNRDRLRISVLLAPCANATGQEATVVASYSEVDRVQAAAHFVPTLLWGKTEDNWDWRELGLVIFLGGDQLFPVLLGRRWGYKTLVYAEWEARWHRWVDHFAVMTPQILAHVAVHDRAKCTVVGDLMADLSATQTAAIAQVRERLKLDEGTELVGFLPGSKAAKLAQGVPFCLAIAEPIHAARPQTQFVIPVAPTLSLTELAKYADPAQNPVLALIPGNDGGQMGAATLLPADATHDLPRLRTATGVTIWLWPDFPAHAVLSQCQLCVTTVGANTAELGSLAIPMLVLIPTQQLDAMRAWDGLPGLLANLPGVGASFAKLINTWMLRRLGDRLLAWPNIWAGRRIVPELVGTLHPNEIATLALDWLQQPEQLAQIQADLRSVRGQPGAAARLADCAIALLEPNHDSISPRRASPDLS